MWSAILFCTSLIIISNAETMNDEAHCIDGDGNFVSHGITARFNGAIMQCLNGTFSPDPRCLFRATNKSYSLGQTTVAHAFQYKCTFLPNNQAVAMRLSGCEGANGDVANSGQHFLGKSLESLPFQASVVYRCQIDEDGRIQTMEVGWNVAGEFVDSNELGTFSRRLPVGSEEYDISFTANGSIYYKPVATSTSQDQVNAKGTDEVQADVNTPVNLGGTVHADKGIGVMRLNINEAISNKLGKHIEDGKKAAVHSKFASASGLNSRYSANPNSNPFDGKLGARVAKDAKGNKYFGPIKFSDDQHYMVRLREDGILQLFGPIKISAVEQRAVVQQDLLNAISQVQGQVTGGAVHAGNAIGNMLPNMDEAISNKLGKHIEAHGNKTAVYSKFASASGIRAVGELGTRVAKDGKGNKYFGPIKFTDDQHYMVRLLENGILQLFGPIKISAVKQEAVAQKAKIQQNLRNTIAQVQIQGTGGAVHAGNAIGDMRPNMDAAISNKLGKHIEAHGNQTAVYSKFASASGIRAVGELGARVAKDGIGNKYFGPIKFTDDQHYMVRLLEDGTLQLFGPIKISAVEQRAVVQQDLLNAIAQVQEQVTDANQIGYHQGSTFTGGAGTFHHVTDTHKVFRPEHGT